MHIPNFIFLIISLLMSFCLSGKILHAQEVAMQEKPKK